MQHPECIYCSKDNRLHDLMIEISKLQVSTVYLFKEQTYRGRCVVALNHHETEIFHLPEEQRQQFTQDLCQVAAAIEQAFAPQKVNYGAYGDTMPHVHFHIVPKYEGGPAWGTTFEMNPRQTYLSDAEYTQLIEQIKKHL